MTYGRRDRLGPGGVFDLMRFLARAVFAVALLVPVLAQAQTAPIAGDWYGTLDAGIKLPLIFHIQADGATTLDSPSQGAKALPATATLADGQARIALKIPPASFEGALSADGKILNGQWRQGGGVLPLVLSRDAPVAVVGPNRPQTPRPPFPYRAEEVSYGNPASGLKLAGTLTLPEGHGPFPVALLITGSGPQDRDGTIFDHKPFLLIADRLTRKGVAVLRVDDRGVGGSGRGPDTVTSADFATDVEAGIAFLRGRQDIDSSRIGLIGHSEGGLIAPMVAARDAKIAFLVLMAAPGVDGETMLLAQARAVESQMGLTAEQLDTLQARRKAWYAVIREEPDPARARARLRTLLDEQGAPTDAPMRATVASLTAPWWRYMLTYQPRDNLGAVKAPVLAINGSKDLQVLAAANLAGIKAALPPTTEATIRELPNLNHLFQTTRTGMPTEYAPIEETLAPIALDLIVDWTVAHAVRK